MYLMGFFNVMQNFVLVRSAVHEKMTLEFANFGHNTVNCTAVRIIFYQFQKVANNTILMDFEKSESLERFNLKIAK